MNKSIKANTMQFRVGDLFCGVDTQHLELWLTYRVLLAIDTYIGPNALSLLLAFTLFCLIMKRLSGMRMRGSHRSRQRRRRLRVPMICF